MSAAWPIPAAEMERMEAFRALAELVGLPGITGPEAGLNPRPGSKADSCWQIRHLPDAVRQALGRALMVRGRTSRPHVKIRKGEDVSTVTYVGHGVEIEDDAARLRRRKLEFDEMPLAAPTRAGHGGGARTLAWSARRPRPLPAGGDRCG